jgi:RimJ/RimL family protein N-acetyltransferase
VTLAATRAAFDAALPLETRSERLGFRSLYPLDAGALHEVERHWDVVRQLGPKWPWPADPAFAVTRAKPYRGEGFAWAVLRGGHMIGTVSVTEGELGYSLHPDHQRNGLMFEACQAALGRAFGSMGLAEVTANVWADHAASLGLLGKLGFDIVGDNSGTSNCRPEPSPGYDLILRAEDWARGSPGSGRGA